MTVTREQIPESLAYLHNIKTIFENDEKVILEKDVKQYHGSWKKRGGVGAYFTMVRKIDSLVTQCDEGGYNIFRLCVVNGSKDGGTLEQVRDLRRYLALIEAELMQRALVEGGMWKVVLDGYQLPASLHQEGPQEGGGVASRTSLGNAVAQANPLPAGLDYNPPLICQKVAMAYDDIYDTYIPFSGNGSYRALKNLITYGQWKGLPNEFQKYYETPKAFTTDVMLRPEFVAEIQAFGNSFLPGGSNYTSS